MIHAKKKFRTKEEKENLKQKRIRVGYLLDICRECDYNVGSYWNKKCDNCKVKHEIQSIGKQLIDRR